jgi:hypothetical protein
MAAAAQPAVLAGYLVHRPGAHPLWSCYWISVVHLRVEPELQTPKLQFDGASHELSIWSLNPDHMATPDPSVRVEDLKWLEPPDLSFQFTGTDDEAERLVGDAVAVICRYARVSPDSDFRAWWNRALTNTLEHYRTGAHGARP